MEDYEAEEERSRGEGGVRVERRGVYNLEADRVIGEEEPISHSRMRMYEHLFSPCRDQKSATNYRQRYLAQAVYLSNERTDYLRQFRVWSTTTLRLMHFI